MAEELVVPHWRLCICDTHPRSYEHVAECEAERSTSVSARSRYPKPTISVRTIAQTIASLPSSNLQNQILRGQQSGHIEHGALRSQRQSCWPANWSGNARRLVHQTPERYCQHTGHLTNSGDRHTFAVSSGENDTDLPSRQ